MAGLGYRGIAECNLEVAADSREFCCDHGSFIGELQGADFCQHVTDIPPEVKAEINAVTQTPYWKGIYAWAVGKIKGEETSSGEGALFYQIRNGEIWRLITPVILHKDPVVLVPSFIKRTFGLLL